MTKSEMIDLVINEFIKDGEVLKNGENSMLQK